MLFDQCVQLLSPTETSPGVWEWVETEELWVHAIQRDKGQGRGKGSVVREVLFTLPRYDIRLGEAVRWQGEHHTITAIRPLSEELTEVCTVRNAVMDCTALRGTGELDEWKRPVGALEVVARFPGVLEDKKAESEQLEPMTRVTRTCTLCTPKGFDLRYGDLVDAGGERFALRTSRLLDPYRNEYELSRKADA